MAAASTLRELWDTTRMRLLVEIERQGSVSAAAAEIGIGQPSASQHLRLLEAAAGQRLVERTGRGSRLTQAGSILAARAAQALATLAAAEEELGALAGLETGTIHLGESTAPGVYLLPDTLGCFEATTRAAREALCPAFLSRYAVAEEVERGDLVSFRIGGRPPMRRHFSVAHLAGRPLSPAEQSFVATLTSCCAKQADYAAA